MYELITVFLYSCMEADLNTLKRLINAGYNVNTMDYDKRTGLHVAASEGHYDVVKFLLENGASPVVYDRWDNTPLDDAARG